MMEDDAETHLCCSFGKVVEEIVVLDFLLRVKNGSDMTSQVQNLVIRCRGKHLQCGVRTSVGILVREDSSGHPGYEICLRRMNCKLVGGNEGGLWSFNV